MIQRRNFLLGLLAAPVIVKASSLMAIKPVPPLIVPENAVLETMYKNYTRLPVERTVTGWSITATGHDQYGRPQTEVLFGVANETVRSNVVWGYADRLTIKET